ncbi:MAG: hypothetical protein ACI92A_001853, partial [Candidatus Paceibacteria bacterium]
MATSQTDGIAVDLQAAQCAAQRLLDQVSAI